MCTQTTEQHPDGYPTLHPHDWQEGGRSPEDGEVRWYTCGTCGRSWDDAFITGRTPTPAGRCPFEAEHDEEDEGDDREPVAFRVYVMLTLDVHAPSKEDAIDFADEAADGIVFRDCPIEDISYAVIEDGPDEPYPIRFLDD